jgi:hypothetical protein
MNERMKDVPSNSFGDCPRDYGHKVEAPVTQPKLTLAQRCKLATDCLPDAEYRRRLEALHDELLAALDAQTAQAEPVAWISPTHVAWLKTVTHCAVWRKDEKLPDYLPLYLGPQQDRQPLTDEQIHLLLADDFFNGMPLIVDRMFRVLIRVIEKAHGIGGKL